MTALLKRIRKSWEYGLGRTVLAAFCAHSVCISVGICQGYSAILIPQLTNSTEYNVDSEEASWLASLGAITNPVGSILSGTLAEYFGRKRSMQATTLPFLIGWLCIGFARDINWLYAGRLITGIAAGMSAASYTYTSEISPSEYRGLLQALGPASASFGILLTYTLGYLLHWNMVALISIAFCIFTLIAIQLLPESPAYLMKLGKTQESFDIYLWFRRNNAMAQEEVERHTINQGKQALGGFREKYLVPETIKPFCILVILFLLQELSGIYTILFYTVNFFQETNLEINEFLSSILVGVIRFVMSIAVAFMLNKFGRKSLCMVSSFGMAVTILPLAILMKYIEVSGDKVTGGWSFLPLFSILFNVFFSMFGMLPIPYILSGEFFPLKVRAMMSGVIICMAQCFIFICVKIYPDLVLALNFSGTLFTFFGASVLAVIFCKFVLPETKNRSLEEIEEYFRSGEVPETKTSYTNNAFVITPENSSVFAISVQE